MWVAFGIRILFYSFVRSLIHPIYVMVFLFFFFFFVQKYMCISTITALSSCFTCVIIRYSHCHFFWTNIMFHSILCTQIHALQFLQFSLFYCFSLVWITIYSYFGFFTRPLCMYLTLLQIMLLIHFMLMWTIGIVFSHWYAVFVPVPRRIYQPALFVSVSLHWFNS